MIKYKILDFSHAPIFNHMQFGVNFLTEIFS